MSSKLSAAAATPRLLSTTLRIPSTARPIPLPFRFYSTTPETTPSTPEAGADQAKADSSETKGAEDAIQKELDAKNREVIELKDRYLRSVADFRNLQDRTKRDIASARDFAISRFAKDLIDSVDNLDRALSTVPAEKLSVSASAAEASADDDLSSAANQDLVNLYDGLKMTERILMSTLQKHGLERFDPSEKGERFDPNLHEATFMTKVEGKEDGTAFSTVQKGFKLNGRVLRAAKVGVVKNS